MLAKIDRIPVILGKFERKNDKAVNAMEMKFTSAEQIVTKNASDIATLEPRLKNWKVKIGTSRQLSTCYRLTERK
jgi:hypothetical protein